ncbi:hypothetical protein FA13DRAFT_1886296 [Coprinellus micaceus]|uniref:Uncharacterized protein n=1 Tax=Coprinellus micaceus TaxID=71717 RepID=A0A4Y7SYH8_COPMI|nr:hypothetical protein FA13DRAFT_1886296 [Coprinellus micaceus]
MDDEAPVDPRMACQTMNQAALHQPLSFPSQKRKEYRQTPSNEEARLAGCVELIKGVIQAYIHQQSPFDEFFSLDRVYQYLPQWEGLHIAYFDDLRYPPGLVAAMTSDDPWAEFMGLNPSPVAQGTVTMNLGRDLEVNLSMLDHTIDDFFLETIEGAAPQVQTLPRPSTSEVIKGLSFKKTTAAPEPEAMDPLFNANLIPEVEYETGEGDVDMDVDRSPEPSVIITT